MPELSDEAKTLIRNEFEDLVKKNEKVLDEFKRYAWVARTLVIFVIGGSIAGFFEARSYVDKQITERANQFDNLYVASALSMSDPASAYEVLTKFKGAKLDTENKRWILDSLTEPEKQYFFITALKILAAIPTKDRDELNRSFIGKTAWVALTRNQDFKSTHAGSSASRESNVQMGVANLRFAETSQDIERAINYLDEAYRMSKTDGDKRYVRWYSGFANFCLGRKDEAIKQLSLIFDASWRNYSSIYYAQYLKTKELNDAFGYDADLFATIWTRFLKTGFSEAAKQALLAAQLSSHLTYFLELDSEEKQQDALQKASALRVQFIQAGRANDSKTLNKLLKIKDVGYQPDIDIDERILKTLALRDTQAPGRIVDAQPSNYSSLTGSNIRGVTITVDFVESGNHAYWMFSSDPTSPEGWRYVWSPDIPRYFTKASYKKNVPPNVKRQPIHRKHTPPLNPD